PVTERRTPASPLTENDEIPRAGELRGSRAPPCTTGRGSSRAGDERGVTRFARGPAILRTPAEATLSNASPVRLRYRCTSAGRAPYRSGRTGPSSRTPPGVASTSIRTGVA